MTPVWTWGGTHFGYIDNDLLFTYGGKCVGRVEKDAIYGKGGRYIGEVMNGDRLITSRSKSSWSGSPPPNAIGGSIARYVNYVGNVMYAGYEDFPDPDTF